VIDGGEASQLHDVWLAPLVSALRAGRISELQVIIGRWHLRATRGMLRRFWRKPLPLAQWQSPE
jgi:hypothetical protein